MFFIVSKILAFLVTPVIWIFALLLTSLFSKDPKRKRKLLLLTIIVFYLFGNSFVFDHCMDAWQIEPISYASITVPYDAGIVLGGAITYYPAIDRFQFQRQGDRIMQAVLLYKAGKIKKILFSGGAGALSEPENKEGPRVKAFLLDIGIPESDILIEGESRNTRQNAVMSKALLDKNFQNGKYLLITSAPHERRAMKCFEKIGVSVTPFSVDLYTDSNKFDLEHLFIPNAHTLFKWEALTHEIAGLLIYKIAGYA